MDFFVSCFLLFPFLAGSCLTLQAWTSGALTVGDPLIAIYFYCTFFFDCRNDRVRFFTKSITSTEMVLQNLVFQMSTRHSLQFGVTLGFGFPNRVLDMQRDQMFEKIRFLELHEVRIIQ